MVLLLRFLVNILEFFRVLIYVVIQFLVFIHRHCTYFSFNCEFFSCPGHPFIAASADGFTLVKYVVVMIIIIIIIIGELLTATSTRTAKKQQV